MVAAIEAALDADAALEAAAEADLDADAALDADTLLDADIALEAALEAALDADLALVAAIDARRTTRRMVLVDFLPPFLEDLEDDRRLLRDAIYIYITQQKKIF